VGGFQEEVLREWFAPPGGKRRGTVLFKRRKNETVDPSPQPSVEKTDAFSVTVRGTIFSWKACTLPPKYFFCEERKSCADLLSRSKYCSNCTQGELHSAPYREVENMAPPKERHKI